MHPIVAFYATLCINDRDLHGIALRDPEQRVWFRTETTGQWRELFDTDRANLHLHGRCELVAAQVKAA